MLCFLTWKSVFKNSGFYLKFEQVPLLPIGNMRLFQPREKPSFTCLASSTVSSSLLFQLLFFPMLRHYLPLPFFPTLSLILNLFSLSFSTSSKFNFHFYGTIPFSFFFFIFLLTLLTLHVNVIIFSCENFVYVKYWSHSIIDFNIIHILNICSS